MVERQISFEFAALFHSPIRAAKKDGNFKINLFMDQMVSFLFCLCSGCGYPSLIIRPEFLIEEKMHFNKICQKYCICHESFWNQFYHSFLFQFIFDLSMLQNQIKTKWIFEIGRKIQISISHVEWNSDVKESLFLGFLRSKFAILLKALIILDP